MRQLKISIYGGGTLIQELLGRIKNSSWLSKINWYSESTDEIQKDGRPFSYRAIINTKALDKQAYQEKLKTQISFQLWANECRESDMIIFASGPHITDYSGKATDRTSSKHEQFQKEMFEQTEPRLRRVTESLDSLKVEVPLLVISTPSEKLLRSAKQHSKRNPYSFFSVSPDGKRARRICYEHIKRYLPSITYQNLKGITIIGEHSDPRILLQESFLKITRRYVSPELSIEVPETITDLATLFSKMEIKTKSKNRKQSYQDRVNSELKQRGARTMQDSRNLGTGYVEEPEEITEFLEEIAFERWKKPEKLSKSSSRSCYVPELDAYIQWKWTLEHEGKKRALLVPNPHLTLEKLAEIEPEYEKLIVEQARKQKQLIQ
jgi:hypothetical protein